MRMLCIAAEHDPPGYVAVNGQPLEPEDLARITGSTILECQRCLDELERRGVFSRDRRGWIYSRRMISEAKMRRKASEWGKKGGNPKLRKQKEKSGEDKGEYNPAVEAPDKPHMPEARSHTIPIDESIGAASGSSEDEFDPVKALFDDGIRVLKKAGSPEKSARSLIGRWRKDYGDDLVALAIAASESRSISAPIEWIPRYLLSRKEAQPEQRDKREQSSFVDQVLADAEAARGGRSR